MIRIYGSHLCPDCIDCKLSLDRNLIPYEFRDVSDNIRYLHDFRKRRDTLPLFDHAKKIHDIGLPTLIFDDGTRTRDWEGYLKKKGLPCHYDGKRKKNSCSLDKKGC